jgi:hypothetical protein
LPDGISDVDTLRNILGYSNNYEQLYENRGQKDQLQLALAKSRACVILAKELDLPFHEDAEFGCECRQELQNIGAFDIEKVKKDTGGILNEVAEKTSKSVVVAGKNLSELAKIAFTQKKHLESQ